MSADAKRCVWVALTLLPVFSSLAWSENFREYAEFDNPTTLKAFTAQPWYFVHITDPHCHLPEEGWDDWSQSPSVSRWSSDLEQIATFDPPPAFVLCSGDLVEFGAGGGGNRNYTGLLGPLYSDDIAQEYYVDKALTIPIYFCPGNHDAKLANFLPSSFENYHRAVKDADYYKVVGDGYAMLSLNSGFDAFNDPHWLLPEGDGLYYDNLRSLCSDLASLDDSACKIIMMHHPYVNPEGEFVGPPWNGWVDGVFLNYRVEFIQACDDYEVDVVVFGHVHEGKSGGPFVHGGVWNRYGGKWAKGDGTRFVITNAIKSSNSYRRITVAPPGEIQVGGVEHFSDPGSVGTAAVFRLNQNYPNPFNTFTRINFNISNESDVQVVIHNVLGQRVYTLVDGYLEAGEYDFGWNGTGSDGRLLAAGIYFCRLVVGDLAETKKMVLLK